MKPLFIVFEGIDGCGKTTHIGRFADYLRSKDKYQEILLAREPTRKAREIVSRLEQDGDAFSHGSEMARGYIEDRQQHFDNLILPALNQGAIVLCDRFTLSTLAYQSTQGEDLAKLVEMHNEKRIPAPDLTFYLDISAETAYRRINKGRKTAEKFEQLEFLRPLVETHRRIVELAKTHPCKELLGDVIQIDGEKSIGTVGTNIINQYELFRGN